MKYVYLLKDSSGKVVEVGQSIQPERRYSDKVLQPPYNNGQTKRGHFYGQDIELEVVSELLPSKEAYALEQQLKIDNGLRPTELIRDKANARKHLTKTGICKYCGLEARLVNITRWHNDKCKHKDLDQR